MFHTQIPPILSYSRVSFFPYNLNHYISKEHFIHEYAELRAMQLKAVFVLLVNECSFSIYVSDKEARIVER